MVAAIKMEKPMLDVNQWGDLANYGLEEVTPEAVSAAYWETRFPAIEGGSGKVDFSNLEEFGIEQQPWYKGAVERVEGFLRGLHLPKVEQKPKKTIATFLGRREPAVAAVAPESEEAGRNRFFGWLGEQKRRFDEWRKQPVFGEREEAPVPAAVAPAAPEGEADRFGWVRNGWKYLSGLPGGLFNKFRRQPEAGAAPKISRAEGKKALRESAKQFVEQHGLTLVGGLLGIVGAAAGAAVVSPENIGMVNSYITEVSAMGVAGLSLAGLTIGEERGPENIPQAEKAYQRPIRALQRLCSQKAVRTGLFLTGGFATGFAAGGLGRMVFDILQQGVSATAPAPAEVGSATDIANAIGDTRREVIDAAQQGAQQAAQLAAEQQTAIQDMVGQSEAAFTQANQALSSIGPDLSGNPSVSPLLDSAQQALRTANQFYSDAMASGGIDATEAAKLQDLATQAQAAVDQAVNTANQIRAAAADAAAATEVARQAALQTGQVMKDVIAATPSQTAFEALQQQVFGATGSPHSAEAANALSWSLPHGDITGLHTGAIGEAAKKVTDLISQAHDYAASHGVSYTIHSIRQAVDAGQLTPDVLKAVEAANAPAGSDVKTAAQTGLNTILQTVVK